MNEDKLTNIKHAAAGLLGVLRTARDKINAARADIDEALHDVELGIDDFASAVKELTED